MVGILLATFSLILDAFKPRARLEAELIVLRHEISVLLRTRRPRVRLTNAHRAFLVWIYRLFPTILSSRRIIRPETIIRWHRQGFRAYWRWKSRGRIGRPSINREARDLIKRMSIENPLWGAPRIHGELLKLGFTVAQSTVAKYMGRRRNGGDGQTWKTFLRNQAEGIASIDLFSVTTLRFEQLYAFVILSHTRRQITFLTATGQPTGLWLAQQLTEAFPGKPRPRL